MVLKNKIHISFKHIIGSLLFIALFFVSCRQESDEFIDSGDALLNIDSNISNLLKLAAMKDGSADDILDGSSCISIQLPVTIQFNGLDLSITSEIDIDALENIFDGADVPITFDFVFPIMVVLGDFTEVEVYSGEQLKSIIEDCESQEQPDSIRCIDFEYPMSASVYNPSAESLKNVTFRKDRQLYRFLRNIKEEDRVNLNFPIGIRLNDGALIETETLPDLERAIERNDLDCEQDNLSSDQFVRVLTQKKIRVQKLKIGTTNMTQNFRPYKLKFQQDGTVLLTKVIPQEPDMVSEGFWEIQENQDGSLSAVFDFGDQEPLLNANGTWKVNRIQNSRLVFSMDTNQTGPPSQFFMQHINTDR